MPMKTQVQALDSGMIRSAVALSDGKVGFHIGETQWGGPMNWYGQSIGDIAVVDAISLNTLLGPLETVDLIDLDVQGIGA
jgi:hypothetical protein